MRALSMKSVALVFTFAAGCYHPHIGDQSLQCGPGGLCPEGFVCDAENLCAKKSDNTDGGEANPVYSGLLGTKDLTGLSGTLECSTSTGAITLVASDMTQHVVIAANTVGFARLAQTSGPPLGVWSFAALTIPSTIVVKPTSDSDAMPVFAAQGALEIDGNVSWRGYGGFHGLAESGGQSRDSGVLYSGGEGGITGGGGDGGGYGASGTGGLGDGGGTGGKPYGLNDLSILHAGSGGGGGGSSASGSGGVGGNGGGAIAFLSNTSIGITGQIDVSGNDGSSGDMDCGGGGGGSGGSILVSAPTIAMHTGHSLSALGGNGGAGMGVGGEGGAGAIGRIHLAGGLTVDGMLTAQPTVDTSTTPETTFPAGARSAR